VRGSIQDVWRAVASGPGLTAWFVPTEVDGRLGGEVLFHFGEYGTDICEVTAWDPPHRFEWSGEQRGRLVSQEFVVTVLAERGQADGPRCRVVFRNHGFGRDESWDELITLSRQSWATLLGVLQLSLEHFPGRPCATELVNGCGEGTVAEVWRSVLGHLAMEHPRVGDEVRLHLNGGPRLRCRVTRYVDQLMTMLVLDPAPAILVLGAQPMGPDQVHVAVYAYSYDDDPEAEVRALGRQWQGWMDRWFPLELDSRRWEPPS
jgi:uncharacterized protein YndB with AHSA1/START domain